MLLMTTITLHATQLQMLLQANGIDHPVGVAPTQFYTSNLADSITLDDADQALVAVVANPQFVVRAHKEMFDSATEMQWYYVAGSDVVALTTTDSAEWTLTRFGDVRAALHHVERWLTPRPAPEDAVYKFVADSEDVVLTQDMRDVWAEVPALAIIESYGLDISTASELFDAMVEPEWRGRIDFMHCQDGDISDDRTIYILQGVTLSWVGYPRSARKQHLVIETAQADALRAAITSVWDGITGA
jgi:hypothetical protein